MNSQTGNYHVQTWKIQCENKCLAPALEGGYIMPNKLSGLDVFQSVCFHIIIFQRVEAAETWAGTKMDLADKEFC